MLYNRTCSNPERSMNRSGLIIIAVGMMSGCLQVSAGDDANGLEVVQTTPLSATEQTSEWIIRESVRLGLDVTSIAVFGAVLSLWEADEPATLEGVANMMNLPGVVTSFAELPLEELKQGGIEAGSIATEKPLSLEAVKVALQKLTDAGLLTASVVTTYEPAARVPVSRPQSDPCQDIDSLLSDYLAEQEAGKPSPDTNKALNTCIRRGLVTGIEQAKRKPAQADIESDPCHAVQTMTAADLETLEGQDLIQRQMIACMGRTITTPIYGLP